MRITDGLKGVKVLWSVGLLVASLVVLLLRAHYVQAAEVPLTSNPQRVPNGSSLSASETNPQASVTSPEAGALSPEQLPPQTLEVRTPNATNQSSAQSTASPSRGRWGMPLTVAIVVLILVGTALAVRRIMRAPA